MAKHCPNCGTNIDHRHVRSVYCLPCGNKSDTINGARPAREAISLQIGQGLRPKAATFPCVDCGIQAEEYDHRHYGLPFDVVPVCRPCNRRRGPGVHAYMPIPEQQSKRN